MAPQIARMMLKPPVTGINRSPTATAAPCHARPMGFMVRTLDLSKDNTIEFPAYGSCQRRCPSCTHLPIGSVGQRWPCPTSYHQRTFISYLIFTPRGLSPLLGHDKRCWINCDKGRINNPSSSFSGGWNAVHGMRCRHGSFALSFR